MAEQKALDIRPQPALPAETAEPVNLLAAIVRAASDPSVDVDKMERLMAMQERLEARQAKAAYTKGIRF